MQDDVYHEEDNIEILDVIRKQMKSKPVDAPDVRNPFDGDEELERQLWMLIRSNQENGYVPTGFGLTPGEYGYNGQYESVQHLPIGVRKKGKSQRLILTETVWRPRTIAWVQSLESLYRILDSVE